MQADVETGRGTLAGLSVLTTVNQWSKAAEASYHARSAIANHLGLLPSTIISVSDTFLYPLI